MGTSPDFDWRRLKAMEREDWALPYDNVFSSECNLAVVEKFMRLNDLKSYAGGRFVSW